MPAFEVRPARADSAIPTAGVPAQKPAWDGSAGVELPVLLRLVVQHRRGGGFRIAGRAHRAARRSTSASAFARWTARSPGFVLVDDAGPRAAARRGSAGLAGAPRRRCRDSKARSRPIARSRCRTTFTPNAFQDELQILVNLPETDDRPTSSAAAGVATRSFSTTRSSRLPFYGQNHARQHKTDKVLLDVTQTGWYHDLNRDPRTRVPAGFGTLGRAEAPGKAHAARLAAGAEGLRGAIAWCAVPVHHPGEHALSGELLRRDCRRRNLMAVTAAVHAKVLGSPTTIRQQLRRQPRCALPVLQRAFRRLARPAGKLARRLSAAATPLHLPTTGRRRQRRRADPGAAARSAGGICRRSMIWRSAFSRTRFRTGCAG